MTPEKDSGIGKFRAVVIIAQQEKRNCWIEGHRVFTCQTFEANFLPSWLVLMIGYRHLIPNNLPWLIPLDFRIKPLYGYLWKHLIVLALLDILVLDSISVIAFYIWKRPGILNRLLPYHIITHQLFSLFPFVVNQLIIFTHLMIKGEKKWKMVILGSLFGWNEPHWHVLILVLYCK